MVTIVDYKSYEKEDGGVFHSLIVQGGLEAVKSKETGQIYFTAKTAQVSSTFDEATCKSLIGSQIPGIIKKVKVDPYEYTNTITGEITTYSERNVFVTEEEEILENNLEEERMVI
ncbi:hypothetical protein [Salegentibacter salarius]|uniref:Uncharacterized protein n=1 Tax=Salegentibacter salarius TaxID=435906 RepID=A0A2N0TRE8_9FLAO|nr:hypothetical protein [Salegentibacter salarius]OEY71955.1 hypothetical protein BHS39_14645 [Salegentibacter salarius]PKD17311.1 hypothetical protein APR40_14615 [Salegentibacter salarius]SLK05536.1 hypothetical protein SAMN05660445_03012 [Salegentibacter salarius]